MLLVLRARHLVDSEVRMRPAGKMALILPVGDLEPKILVRAPRRTGTYRISENSAIFLVDDHFVNLLNAL